MLPPSLFFDLKDLTAAPLLERFENVWEALPQIKPYIKEIIKPNVTGLRKNGEVLAKTSVLWRGWTFDEGFVLQPGDAAKGEFAVLRDGQQLEGATVIYAGAVLMDDAIELKPGAVIEPGALIKGPTIIGENSEVRQGAYMRGSCFIGRRCVVGHTTEVKNVIMLDDAKAGHFAYLGDSILGRDVNLGAGTKLANLKIVASPITITVDGEKMKVDFRKFGAIMGDGAETGCNSVTSPGTVMGPRCLVAPNFTVPPGYHPARTVLRPPKIKS